MKETKWIVQYWCGDQNYNTDDVESYQALDVALMRAAELQSVFGAYVPIVFSVVEVTA